MGGREGRPGDHRRRRLLHAVHEVAQGPGHIGEGVEGGALDGVPAQIVRQAQIRQGGGAVVGEAHHVGHVVLRPVDAGQGLLGDGQGVGDLARGQIGIAYPVPVGQGSLVGKGEHGISSCVECRWYILCGARAAW